MHLCDVFFLLPCKWFKDLTSRASWQAVHNNIKVHQLRSRKKKVKRRSMHLPARVNKDLYRQTIQTNAFLAVVDLVVSFLGQYMIVTGRSAFRKGHNNKCRFENRTNPGCRPCKATLNPKVSSSSEYLCACLCDKYHMFSLSTSSTILFKTC